MGSIIGYMIVVYIIDRVQMRNNRSRVQVLKEAEPPALNENKTELNNIIPMHYTFPNIYLNPRLV